MMMYFGIGWGILIVLLFVTFIGLSVYVGQMAGLAGAEEIKGLFRAMGFSALPASSENAGSQSAMEGICSCLKDTPGGYCYQADSAVTEQVPFVESDYFLLQVK